MLRNLGRLGVVSFFGTVALLLSFSVCAKKDKSVEYQYESLKKSFAEKEQEQAFTRVLLLVEQMEAKKALSKRDVIKRVSIPDAKAWEKLNKSLEQLNIPVDRKVDRLGLVAVTITAVELDKLYKNNSFTLLQEDEFFEVSLSGSTLHIGAQDLHQAGFNGAGQALAILDTGVDAEHPFFAGRVVEEACFSHHNPPSVYSLCPNSSTRQYGDGAGTDCTDRYGWGDCTHGTHVAGIAAGSSGTFSGVAPAADIVSVQVFSYIPSNSRLGAYGSDLVAAFDWLINEAQTPNIASVNMSLGGGVRTTACDSGTLPELIETLRAEGTATVIASGNNGSSVGVSWPGCISSAITVGSTSKTTDSISSFSNTSELVDVLAPGSSIYASVPGTGYGYKSGTSMAAPHVAGAIATLKSAVPSASVGDIENALEQTGVQIYHSGAGMSLPRIDLVAALDSFSGVSPEPDCTQIPGIVVQNAGEMFLGDQMQWPVFAQESGLFRVWLSNTASSGSFAVNVALGSSSTDVSIAAGQSALVDFANIAAGEHVLVIKALSDTVSIGQIEVEQLANHGEFSSGSCINGGGVSVPGIVSNHVGNIAIGATESWALSVENTSNIRVQVTSNSALNSRSITITLNGQSVTMAIDSNATSFVDFAAVPSGEQSLTLTANNEDVSLSVVETILY